jgi:hypothetical protein
LTGQQSGEAGYLEPAPGRAATKANDTDSLQKVVFVALVAACFAAFFVTQRLKHTPTAVQKFKLAGRFSPYAPAPHNQESISFKLGHAEAVTVTIVDASGNAVATLFVDRPIVRYKQFSFHWNGRRGNAHGYRVLTSPHGRSILVPRTSGAVAPPGEYRVEVRLSKQGHTVPSPHSFTLVGR